MKSARAVLSSLLFVTLLSLASGQSQIRSSENVVDTPNLVSKVTEGFVLDTFVPYHIAKHFPWLIENEALLCPSATASPAVVDLEFGGNTIGTATLTIDQCTVDVTECTGPQDVDVQKVTVTVCPAWLAFRKYRVNVAFSELYINTLDIDSGGNATVYEAFEIRICGEFGLSFGKGLQFHHPTCCLQDVEVFDQRSDQRTTSLVLNVDGTNICAGCFSTPPDMTTCAPECNFVLLSLQNAILLYAQTVDATVFDSSLPVCQSAGSLFPVSL